MDIQRLRNLTTCRLHTEMGHIYEDIEHLTGFKGVMTHQLPNALRAMEPWLRFKVTDPRFWDGEFDTSHVGEVELAPMSPEEQKEMWARYGELPNPLAGKEVVVVQV